PAALNRFRPRAPCPSPRPVRPPLHRQFGATTIIVRAGHASTVTLARRWFGLFSSMRIVHLERTPVVSVPFLNASRRGGTDTESLPILLGRLDKLPKELDALLITSDLQGVVPDWRASGESRLLGEHLVDEYVKLYEDGKVPSPARTGAILAGDLY